MSERELQNWELRQREKREQALRTISSAFEDLRVLEDWSRRTPNYEVECMCGRRLSVRTRADEAHEARTNQVADLTAALARARELEAAAGAVVEHFGPYSRAEMSPEGRAVLDALAEAVGRGKA